MGNNQYLNERFEEFAFNEGNTISGDYIKRMKPYEPDQGSFLPFNPKEMFPEETFERYIVNMVQKIDTSTFEKKDQSDMGGNESYNPKSMLALLLYGISRGIYSNHKLADNCIHDIRYIFISGGITPDQSTISRFITRYKDSIVKVFSQIVYIAYKLKYIDYKMIVTDGTKLKANASDKFSGTLADFRKKKESLSKKIQDALGRIQIAENDIKKDYWKKKEERYRDEQGKIDSFLKDAQEIYSKAGTEVRQNITDNDSRLMKKRNGYDFCYNAQVSACGKNGLIVNQEVTNNVNDKELFIPMVEKAMDTAPDEMKEDIKNSVYLNDAGYHSSRNIGYCDKNKLDAYIPEKQDKNVYQENTGETDGKLYKIQKEKGNLQILCLGGRLLVSIRKRVKKGMRFQLLKVDDRSCCKTCKHFSKCQKKEDGNKEFWISEDVIQNYEALKKMKDKILCDDGRMIYSRRMPTVEKIFGCIKGNFHIDSFLVRSFEKVRAHWSLICTSYNLLRMFRLS